jgi:hypothetical protein
MKMEHVVYVFAVHAAVGMTAVLGMADKRQLRPTYYWRIGIGIAVLGG